MASMQRDMDLVREILAAVERQPYTRGPLEIEIAGRNPREIGYHVMLLQQAGLIEAENLAYI
jgi:hypothetical protein